MLMTPPYPVLYNNLRVAKDEPTEVLAADVDAFKAAGWSFSLPPADPIIQEEPPELAELEAEYDADQLEEDQS